MPLEMEPMVADDVSERVLQAGAVVKCAVSEAVLGGYV